MVGENGSRSTEPRDSKKFEGGVGKGDVSHRPYGEERAINAFDDHLPTLAYSP